MLKYTYFWDPASVFDKWPTPGLGFQYSVLKESLYYIETLYPPKHFYFDKPRFAYLPFPKLSITTVYFDYFFFVYFCKDVKFEYFMTTLTEQFLSRKI